MFGEIIYDASEASLMLTGNKRADLVAIAVVIAIFAISSNFLSDFRSLSLTLTFGIFYIVISLKIGLRAKLWFWPVIVTLLIFHIAVIIVANPKLPAGPSLTYIAPVVFADIFGMLAVIRICELLWSNGHAS